MTHSSDVVEDAVRGLQTERIGRHVRSYDVVSSTNDLALAWAAEGAPDGAVVFAEFQKQGRGRLGRSWTARAGVNLTFSVVLRPDLPADRLGLITIAAGVAVADGLDVFVEPLCTQIKWPNDILLEGRKCCGMLLESRGGDGARVVVLGIGLNVNQDAFPGELADGATSLLLATGRPASRPDVLAAILDRLEATLDDVHQDDAGVRRRYMNRMRDLNAPIELRVAERGGTIHGVATGLDASGGLLLATESGIRAFHAGEVTRRV